MIPVYERFNTFQGEGVHMGRAAFFIRTFGCPQHCPWCDSAGTWHKDYVPKHVLRMTEAELVQEVTVSGARVVVITGGEPAVHDLTDLTKLLHAAGKRVHIETSGAFELRGEFDWITVSPKDKWAQPMKPHFNTLADEFKLIIEDPMDIPFWYHRLTGTVDTPVWLHPEWSHREDPAVLCAITKWVKERGDPWRAGWQLHKLYTADSYDPRSKPLVPLGGNPALGY
jgi:organic radical activating enzyme